MDEELVWNVSGVEGFEQNAETNLLPRRALPMISKWITCGKHGAFKQKVGLDENVTTTTIPQQVRGP